MFLLKYVTRDRNTCDELERGKPAQLAVNSKCYFTCASGISLLLSIITTYFYIKNCNM